jgi:hypothetical protein
LLSAEGRALVIDGDPYLTDELDLLRAKHRRLRHEIPRMYLGRSGATQPASLVLPDSTDRSRAETALRAMIERELDGFPLTLFRRYNQAAIIEGLFGNNFAEGFLNRPMAETRIAKERQPTTSASI